MQAPEALHVSLPLHALLSLHDVPTATGACATPPTGSQVSVVHGLLSSTGGAVPAMHVPVALQISLPLQTLPSGQAVPIATGE
jgi:hypothetical protein